MSAVTAANIESVMQTLAVWQSFKYILLSSKAKIVSENYICNISLISGECLRDSTVVVDCL